MEAIKSVVISKNGLQNNPETLQHIITNYNVVNDIDTNKAILNTSDVIYIDYSDIAWAHSILKRCRSDKLCFLKPIASLSHESTPSEDSLLDANIFLENPFPQTSPTIDSLFHIAKELKQYDPIPQGIQEEKIDEINVLRFLSARSNQFTLQPKLDISSMHGYSYPLLEDFLHYDPQKVSDLLDNWEKTKLIQGDVIDTINLCPACNHYNLNFREVCPECSAGRIHEESTVHHFTCGYIGFERDYIDGMKLVCPKCRKELRHIGVDYDKPVDNIWCSSCESHFSDPAIQCFCLHCREINPPHKLINKPIKSYYITNIGVRYAQNGVLPEFGFVDLLKDNFNLYDIKVFKEFLRIELLRCQRYQFPSSLVIFSLQNMNELFEQIGTRAIEKIKREIVEILKRDLRNTDLVTAISGQETAFLFPNTPHKNVHLVINRLIDYFDKAFEHDLHFNYNLFDLMTGSEELERFMANV